MGREALKQKRLAALKRAEAAQKAVQTEGASAESIAENRASWDEALAEVDECDAELAALDAADDAKASDDERMEKMRKLKGSKGPRSATLDQVPSNAPRVTHVRDLSENDPARGFASIGDFGAAVRAACIPGNMADQRLAPLAALDGVNQTNAADGGFLVPPSFATTIWEGINAAPDSLLGRCDQYTVEGESLTFPANAEANNTSGQVFGGVLAYWLAEGDQMTASSPKFRDLKLEPKQLGVLIKASEKLIKNSPVALDQYLTKAATAAINFKVGDAIFGGNGTGKPLGINNSGATVTVAKETNQAAATIVADNINKMWSRLHASCRANAVWFINQEIEPQLEKLNMSVGTGGVPLFTPPGGISESPLARLKGRPIVPIPYCEALGTKGDIVLADMRTYAAGLRGGIEAAMSMHLYFDYNKTAFRFLFEVDGQPWLQTPFTPYKGNNTLSSFVNLATRA